MGEYIPNKIFDLKILFDPQKNYQNLQIDRFGAFLGVLNSLSFFHNTSIKKSFGFPIKHVIEQLLGKLQYPTCNRDGTGAIQFSQKCTNFRILAIFGQNHIFCMTGHNKKYSTLVLLSKYSLY